MSNGDRLRLRILVDGVYIQQSNLSGSSTYSKYVSMIREMVDRGHFVYWCVPDVEYTPHELEDHPNVGIIRTSYIQDQFVIDGLVTTDFFNLFNRVSGKYHIDVICTARTGLALFYKRLLEAPRFHDNDGNYTDKSYGIPTVILEGFPQTRERQATSKAYSLMQCQGYLGADTTIFLSDHNREEITKEMMLYFKTSVIRDWTKRTRIIPAGVRCNELDTYYDADRYKHEKGFNVVSIGRLFGVSYMEFLPWFDYLYKAGLDDVSMTITLSGQLGGPMKAKLKKIGFDVDNNFGRQFRVIEKNPRKNFLRMLKRHHAFVCPVSHYDHPAALFEAIYLGLPGVIPVSDYQQTFFKDWPWVIEPKDHAGLLAHLMWIRENKEEARAMVLPWRERIRELYDAPPNNLKLVEAIEEAGRDHIRRFKTSTGVIDLLRELKGKSYTFADVIAYLKEAGEQGVSVGDMSIRTTFTYARSAIHHAMHMAGFIDPCDGPDDRFVRADVFAQMQDDSKPKRKRIKRRKKS